MENNNEISEHIHLKQEQIKDADFARITAQIMPELVFVYNGSILRHNTSQVAAELGYPEQILLSAEYDMFSIIHEDDVQLLRSALQTSLHTTDKLPDVICRIKNRRGVYNSYLVKFYPAQGVLDSEVVISATNVNSVINEKINEHEQQNVKLIEKLQHANKELEDFAYVASHDLQEPLRKITTFSSRLAEKYSGTIDDDGQMYINRIIASANNMRAFIDNLLEYSRVTRVKQPRIEVNVNFAIKQVLAGLELVIEETGTTVHVGELPSVQADLSQMQQLFDNIISNAIKFHRQDIQPEITIKSSVLDAASIHKYDLNAGTVYHKIEVCDNGIGIEKEYTSHIFKIFQRLHGRSEYPGTGIGLAICQKIVAEHNGIIFAGNNSGPGACFTIILPEKPAIGN